MHIATEPPPTQPPPHITPPLLRPQTRRRRLNPGCQQRRRRLLERALAAPGRLREAKPGDPFQEKRERPTQVEGKRDDAGGGAGLVAAEEWGEVPVEVAGEVGGDEELGVEGWGECRRGEEMG